MIFEIPLLLFVGAATIVGGSGWYMGFIWRHERDKARRERDARPGINYKPPVEPLLVNDRSHGLKECWYSSSGWRWTCECGQSGTLSAFERPKGTEENAILAWKAHVKVHTDHVLPTTEFSHRECDHRFVGLWTLFEKYRKACYCQTTNDELILLNEQAKKIEKPSEKGVQLEA